MNATVFEIASILKEQDNILLLCHSHPDGDTVGSAYALKYAMQACGKNVSVLCADEIPSRLKFICELEADEPICELKSPYICTIDVAQTHLLGSLAEDYGGRIDMKIDHHGSGEPYARVNLVDSSAAACGEIVYDIICALSQMGKAALTPAAATALFAAISSDTGCFKYSNVTAKTMRIAADLMDGGAESYDVNHRLYEVKTKGELAVRRLMLNETEYHLGGQVGILVITDSFRRESGANDDDIGGIVSEIREVQGVELAITLRQDAKDLTKFKISMRSSLNINASELCAMFGGGGHARAAGAAVFGDSPEEAKKRVLDKVLNALKDKE